MDDVHFTNELKQLILIQNKMMELLSKNNTNFSDIHDVLYSTDDVTTKINSLLSKEKDIPKNIMEKINHDLRTPLTPILGYVEMLRMQKFGPLNDIQREKAEIIHKNLEQLINTINSLDGVLSPMQDTDEKTNHEINELRQEKTLYQKLNNFLTDNLNSLQKEKNDFSNRANNLIHKKREKEQESLILGKFVKLEHAKNRQIYKKYLVTITCIAITMTIIITGYSLLVVDLIGSEYRMTNLGDVRSGYVIQNLRGDTIDTWLSWRLVDGATIDVNLIDGIKYPDKTEIVRKVLLSEESIEIDNSLLHKGIKGTTSTYYVGWAGALGSINNPTEFYIPKKFNLIESAKGEGDITIKLTSQQNGDGYSGYTRSIADDAQNQILKSEITIFQADKLSKAQFETILRHELGHALGLAHSTAPEDLMHPKIETDYPYISSCDIDAMILLYDGGQKSEVTCDI